MSKQKTILEKTMDEKPGIIDVSFILEELSLKKKKRLFKFSISETLKRSYRYYRIELYFNSEPFKNRIEANFKHISEIESDRTLFDKSKGGDLDKKKRIAEIRKKNQADRKFWKNSESKCPPYQFTGESEKVEYNKDLFTLLINQSDMDFFNKQFKFLHYYKMQLTPIY